RFIRVRAQYNSTGTDKNPYMRKGWKPSKLAVRVGLLYLLAQVGLLTGLGWGGQALLLAILPPALLVGVSVFFLLLPASNSHQSRGNAATSQKVMSVLRVAYLTAVFYGLAWLTLLTGRWAALYYGLLWVVPLLTSFSFFMILRQWVQHGNGGRGLLTNTR